MKPWKFSAAGPNEEVIEKVNVAEITPEAKALLTEAIHSIDGARGVRVDCHVQIEKDHTLGHWHVAKLF